MDIPGALSTAHDHLFRHLSSTAHAGAMPKELPPDCAELLAAQGYVITNAQCGRSGLSAAATRNRLRYGDWQRLHRGVYASFTGNPAREARLWAALLRAGPDAVLSHQSAAELYGLADGCSPAIHVTVPHEANPARRRKIPGVVVHRSRLISRTRHPVLTPPRTRVEDTILDLIECSKSFDEAYDWICRAIGRRRTTAARILSALKARPRFRWRREIELALGDADGGVLSLLELRYVRGVERPHGLPAAKRQARVRQQTGSRYLDNLYVDYLVCIELDGTAAHPADEQWRDKRRDRRNRVEHQIETWRFGFLDLRTPRDQCETAAEVAAILGNRGPAVGHACAREACPV
jgi:hypothetical protein